MLTLLPRAVAAFISSLPRLSEQDLISLNEAGMFRYSLETQTSG